RRRRDYPSGGSTAVARPRARALGGTSCAQPRPCAARGRAATSSTAAPPVPATGRPRARRTSTPASPGGTRATTRASPAPRGRRRRLGERASLLDIDEARGEGTELERAQIGRGVRTPGVGADL